MNVHLRIIVAESSIIVRNGVVSVLQQININRIEVFEIDDAEQLRNLLCKQKTDILIINPLMFENVSLQQIRKEYANSQLKCVALQTSLIDNSTLKNYDDVISLYDSNEYIKAKINNLVSETEHTANNESLTTREKEIIVCVIKGMTNKQIADELCLSTHTVISHRRNITSKLQIHSTSGLTIYAIVNKLVELNEIKNYSQR
ncbi:MAG: LuxR C-terminal-related transcriptional regulator [Prevotellaceae bacterium]|jgi:DNA-binding NarL/FixJ family response regulator|nr:LuxR C-terminal-related transcriptional regulator [Prevotellaceae bacterium]